MKVTTSMLLFPDRTNDKPIMKLSRGMVLEVEDIQSSYSNHTLYAYVHVFEDEYESDAIQEGWISLRSTNFKVF